MRLSRIFLVQLPGACEPIARAAARRAFPHADIIATGTLAPALATDAGPAADLLVLGAPDEATATAALSALNSVGQPRWAVVFLGGNLPDRAETLPPEEWTEAVLARAFRSVVAQHELLNENLRLKGDLKTVARRIRHDLFTPVGCVATSAHVLDLLSPGDRETMATMIDNIKASSEEITQLIERIAFVLRASAEAPLREPVAMGAIVAEALDQLELPLKQAGASITVAESWPEVKGIPSWLQVIWWNLVDNALKHGGPAPRINLAWEPAGAVHRFTVTDSGPGVAAVRRPHLFLPFDQLHGLPVPGLGLSIAARLVTLQGGTCAYERRDSSSVFSFTLPA